MRIAIGADHGGFRLKNKLARFLKDRGYKVADLGTYSPAPCDYPLVGFKVAAGVSDGQFSRGVLICKSGIGFSIVANKFPGVRAALCLSSVQARHSRQHNDANVLALAANYLSFKQACRIVSVWLKTEFCAGRHGRRVRQIGDIERRIGFYKKSN